MKFNFVQRTGKGNGPSVADEVEKRLASANLLPSRRRIPRSTLNRLLSSEPLRQQVGFTMKSGQFEFIGNEKDSLTALERISRDLADRTIVLGDIWDSEGKKRYLDRLAEESILPKNIAAMANLKGSVKSGNPTAPIVISRAKSVLTAQKALIPNKDFGITWPGRLHRIHRIWEELQIHLDVHLHANAVSVLLRTLLELSVENYIRQCNVEIKENDKLATRLEKAGRHLRQSGKIDDKQLGIVIKFKHGDKLVSADTLNKYVHSQDFAPSPDHLKSMWDSLSVFIVSFVSV